LLLTAVPAGRVGAAGNVSLRPGWPQQGDDPNTGAPLNPTIEGSSGHSGWLDGSSPTVGQLAGGVAIVVAGLDGKAYAFRPNGTRMPGWPVKLDAPGTPAGPTHSTPALGDIDGDGANELVVGDDNGWVFAFDGAGRAKPGWPVFTGNNANYPGKCGVAACTGVLPGPTLADLDGSGGKEVIAGSFSHKMFVWYGNGSVFPGWPRDVWDGIASTAAVGDLDGDGSPDIVVGSDVENDCSNCQPYGVLTKGGLVHAFRVNGVELPGWPARTDSFQWSSPALADLGDGRLSVISGGGDFEIENDRRGHFVAAWRPDGSLRWRYSTVGLTVGSPAVGVIAGKPRIAIGDRSGWLYLLNPDGSVVWKTNGTHANDSRGAGAYFGGPVLADVSGDGQADVVTVDANWNVRAYDLGGALLFDTAVPFSLWNSPAVADLGDGHNSVIAGSAAGTGPGGPTIADAAGPAKVWVYDTPGHGGLVWPQFQSRVTSYRVTSMPGGVGAPASTGTTARRSTSTRNTTARPSGTVAPTTSQPTIGEVSEPSTSTTDDADTTGGLAAPKRSSRDSSNGPAPWLLGTATLLLGGTAAGITYRRVRRR
jgi:hypothetical protein